MSASVRVKSNSAMFSRIRERCVDFGIAMLPSWRCQRRTTCAGDRPRRSASAVMTGWCSARPARAGSTPRSQCVLGVEAPQLLLLEAEVQLDLVDRRDDLCLVDQSLEVVWLEVGHADRPDTPVGVELLQRPPRLDVTVEARLGPMDQVEVDVVQPQPVQARLERAEGAVVALVVVPQLGRDEQFVTGQPTGCERAADPGLVAVQRCRVDAAVAALDRGQHGLFRLAVRNPEHPETQAGHGDTVVQPDVRGGRGHACTVAQSPWRRNRFLLVGRLEVPSALARSGAAIEHLGLQQSKAGRARGLYRER